MMSDDKIVDFRSLQNPIAQRKDPQGRIAAEDSPETAYESAELKAIAKVLTQFAEDKSTAGVLVVALDPDGKGHRYVHTVKMLESPPMLLGALELTRQALIDKCDIEPGTEVYDMEID